MGTWSIYKKHFLQLILTKKNLSFDKISPRDFYFFLCFQSVLVLTVTLVAICKIVTNDSAYAYNSEHQRHGAPFFCIFRKFYGFWKITIHFSLSTLIGFRDSNKTNRQAAAQHEENVHCHVVADVGDGRLRRRLGSGHSAALVAVVIIGRCVIRERATRISWRIWIKWLRWGGERRFMTRTFWIGKRLDQSAGKSRSSRLRHNVSSWNKKI